MRATPTERANQQRQREQLTRDQLRLADALDVRGAQISRTLNAYSRATQGLPREEAQAARDRLHHALDRGKW